MTLEGALGFIKIRACPLPEAVTQILIAESPLLRALSVECGLLTNNTSSAGSTDIPTGQQDGLLFADTNNTCAKVTPSNNISSSNDSCLRAPPINDPFSVHGLAQSLTNTGVFSEEMKLAFQDLRRRLTEAFDAAGEEWSGAVDQLWSVGPHFCGPNIMLNRVKEYSQRPCMFSTGKLALPDTPHAGMDHGLVTGRL